MLEMSVTDFARNLHNVFDRIEQHGEEIIIYRNKHRIARIIPDAPHLTATEAMSDLYKTISDEAAGSWVQESRIDNYIKKESYDPWEC